MAVERFPMPSVEEEDINPRQNVPEAFREEQDRRHEQKDRLSQKILQWWQGDAHTHSLESSRPDLNYAEGVYTLSEMRAYYKRLGLGFVGLSEHTTSPLAPEVIDRAHPVSRSLLRQVQEVHEANEQDPEGLPALVGVEANILFDDEGRPTLDVPSDILEKLDYVVASRHAIAREHEPDAIRESLLAAARHPNVDIIGHMDRHIRLGKENWNPIRAASADAEGFHQEMLALQQQQRESASAEERGALEERLQGMYAMIDKAIGKKPPEPADAENAQLKRWQEDLAAFEPRYFAMFEEVFMEMAQEGKAFEINFNDPPDTRLVELAVKHHVPLFLSFDAHDFDQYKKGRNLEEVEKRRGDKERKNRWATGELPPEELAVLEQYKEERLTSGPGMGAIFRIARLILRLEEMGVKPEDVVNSSRGRFLTYLTERRGRTTPNLTLLREREQRR